MRMSADQGALHTLSPQIRINSGNRSRFNFQSMMRQPTGMNEMKPEGSLRLFEAAVRQMPRQGRSLASFERMLAATKALLLERGEDDFTLLDVSEIGKVSIGSIYLRFDSKEKLLHAVIAKELSEICEKEELLHNYLLASSENLGDFLRRYIMEYSNFLAENSSMLRQIMQKAEYDTEISLLGKEAASRSANLAVIGMLSFSQEIRAPQPEIKARVVFQIIFATIARQFGLGTTADSADGQMWDLVKNEMASMMLAYLQSETSMPTHTRDNRSRASRSRFKTRPA